MFAKNFLLILGLAFIGYIGLPHSAVAQPQPPDMVIDAATRATVIENLIKELNEGYVFPDVAKRLEADLRQRQASNVFDSITSAQMFVKKLTDDLQAISKDKHLRVRFSAQPIPVRAERGQPTAEEIQRQQTMMKRANYGFNRIERLDGNIGYIQFDVFADHEKGAETVASAMGFLANTEAIIFDLRQNGGGNPFMVALISSYLFGDKPVHLNSLYMRRNDRTEDFWTKPELARVRFPNKDIYILTANRTFSAAEEFTYNLKNLKRATIVGETTGGGAHPGGTHRLHEHFSAFVPSGRAINPISKTNWEGTGVEPDVKVPKEQALKTAYLLALNKASANATDPQVISGLKELIELNQRELEQIKAKK
ncbi:MAG TPA: S41 family peptidase [Pyrinomonadaceae bacterium]|nr:S41 family peptidase [Pyrinomonadaceae bacterium]